MCYTGGPYCYKDAQKRLAVAEKAFNEQPTATNSRKLESAKAEYNLTPERIKELRLINPTKADDFQEKYDQLKEGALAYDRLRAENHKEIARIDAKIEANYEEVKKHNRAYYAASNSLKNLENSAIKDPEILANMRSMYEEDAFTAAQQQKQAEDHSFTLISQKRLMEANNHKNLALRKAGKPLSYDYMMPEKFRDYFAATHQKHFTHDSPGSTFTETKNLSETLALAHKQRGTLSGDDREILIKEHGADPSSFYDDKRYIMVKTKGQLGSVNANQLPPETMLTVHKKDKDTTPVCVAEVDSKPETNVGTIVLVDDPSMPGTTGHSKLLITAFPGVSGARGSNSALEPFIGQQITLAQARELYEGKDFSVNTILKK